MHSSFNTIYQYNTSFWSQHFDLIKWPMQIEGSRDYRVPESDAMQWADARIHATSCHDKGWKAVGLCPHPSHGKRIKRFNDYQRDLLLERWHLRFQAQHRNPARLAIRKRQNIMFQAQHKHHRHRKLCFEMSLLVLLRACRALALRLALRFSRGWRKPNAQVLFKSRVFRCLLIPCGNLSNLLHGLPLTLVKVGNMCGEVNEYEKTVPPGFLTKDPKWPLTAFNSSMQWSMRHYIHSSDIW